MHKKIRIPFFLFKKSYLQFTQKTYQYLITYLKKKLKTLSLNFKKPFPLPLKKKYHSLPFKNLIPLLQISNDTPYIIISSTEFLTRKTSPSYPIRIRRLMIFLFNFCWRNPGYVPSKPYPIRPTNVFLLGGARSIASSEK